MYCIYYQHSYILISLQIPARASASVGTSSSSSHLGRQMPPMRRYSNFGNSTAAISAAAASVTAGASSSSASSTTVISQQPFSAIRTAATNVRVVVPGPIKFYGNFLFNNCFCCSLQHRWMACNLHRREEIR